MNTQGDVMRYICESHESYTWSRRTDVCCLARYRAILHNRNNNIDNTIQIAVLESSRIELLYWADSS